MGGSVVVAAAVGVEKRGGKPGGGLMGMCQSPVRWVRNPSMMRVPLWKILRELASKIAVQLLSQSCPREMREPDPCASSSNMWAVQASGGSPGIEMSPSCVDVMYLPLATRTRMGFVVGLILRHSAVVIRKWAVAALSNAAMLGLFVGGEGPGRGLFKFNVDWLL